MLKADVWRDHLLQEEIALNTKLAELDAEGDDKRFVDAREEASSRLAEVHARLADMEAESGPARAAALLAGMCPKSSHRHSKPDAHLQVWDSTKRTKNVQQNPSAVVGGAYIPTRSPVVPSDRSLECALPLLVRFLSRLVSLLMSHVRLTRF